DRVGRDLPVWQGCRVIGDSEIFLMNGQVRDSLDGRYFGPIPASSVIGRAIPLWTDEEGDGRHEWRAPTHRPPSHQRERCPSMVFSTPPPRRLSCPRSVNSRARNPASSDTSGRSCSIRTLSSSRQNRPTPKTHRIIA